jgi:hypothetical protein
MHTGVDHLVTVSKSIDDYPRHRSYAARSMQDSRSVCWNAY